MARELATITFILVETQRQAEEWESFVIRRRGGFRNAPIGSCWHGEAVGELMRSKLPFVISAYLVFSVFSVAQSCPTLCKPMDCSLPGSSIHGIFQARILE